MGTQISGFSFKPTDQSAPYHWLWRVYGTRKLPDKSKAWEMVTEFKLKRVRGKITFPAFELEPTDTGGFKFYQLVPVTADGLEVWHDGEELTLPGDLPDEFEPPFDVPTWLLWNLERQGVIAPGQLRD